ncbi:MAG: rod shape-determining protein RodA [Candidatus Margulisbacteria bacterium]|nr:rod shape-determining protein RodA [Candidatus Margulisiibacteriota bacterium]
MLKVSDVYLWGAVSALVVIGLLAIFSTTYSMQIKLNADAFFFVKRQLFSLLIGGLGLAVFAYFDYNYLKKLAPVFYLGMVGLLALILFVDTGGQATQRWFQIGSFSFQPSELSKIIMVISLAAFFSAKKKISSFKDAVFLLGLVGIPFLLIFKQPDLGTALVFIFMLIGMLASTEASGKLLVILVTPMISALLRPFIFLWLAYLVVLMIILFLKRASFTDWLMILGLNIAVGIALPFIWGMLKTYQQQRILSFINPGLDLHGAGYHSLQSKIAIGSGGFFGTGFLQGSQTQLQFIPEQHSDFIFSVIGEEFGFIGAIIVLALFAVVVWRALVIARDADDSFGSILATGIAVMMAFHIFANIGMTLGLLPVVGMPLPFVSFGGSSLLMNLIAIGILQSIAMRQHKIIF